MIGLEVCCGSVSDAAAAERGGASRIELNSALSLGGLTPDIGNVVLCKERVKLPVIVMIRPRGGGFCYTPEEYQAMQESTRRLLECNADGAAFGILTEKREIDTVRTREMAELVHSYGKQAVFHRAFDCVFSFARAAEQLIAAGIDRVLTSGGAETASGGMACLKSLQEEYGDRLEILAGSGVRSANVTELLQRTGVSQVHSSCRGYGRDNTARGNGVSFSYEGVPEWNCFETVSETVVREIKTKLTEWEGCSC